MDIDRLSGSQRESSHLLRGDPREEGTPEGPSEPPRWGGCSHLEPGGLSAAPPQPITHHTCEHTHLPHPPTLSAHSWGWFLWSFVFNSFWPLKLRSRKARWHWTGNGVMCNED